MKTTSNKKIKKTNARKESVKSKTYNEKSKKCTSCVYRASSNVAWNCDYLYLTGHSRQCEPGDECTKYIKSSRKKTSLLEK